MAEAEMHPVGGLLFIVIRAFGLWIVVPVGLVFGIFVFPSLYRQGASFGQYLGWLDVNFAAALLCTVLRPLRGGVVPPFVPLSKVGRVTHRIGVLDAY